MIGIIERLGRFITGSPETKVETPKPPEEKIHLSPFAQQVQKEKNITSTDIPFEQVGIPKGALPLTQEPSPRVSIVEQRAAEHKKLSREVLTPQPQAEDIQTKHFPS